MGDGYLGAEEPQVAEMRLGGLAVMTKAVELLVDRLLHVDVDAGVEPAGVLLDPDEEVVGAPLDVGGAQKEPDAMVRPVTAVVLEERGEQLQVLVRRGGGGLDTGTHRLR